MKNILKTKFKWDKKHTNIKFNKLINSEMKFNF